jgi:hypothetical protein
LRASFASGQAAISASVRPQPAHHGKAG